MWPQTAVWLSVFNLIVHALLLVLSALTVQVEWRAYPSILVSHFRMVHNRHDLNFKNIPSSQKILITLKHTGHIQVPLISTQDKKKKKHQRGGENVILKFSMVKIFFAVQTFRCRVIKYCLWTDLFAWWSRSEGFRSHANVLLVIFSACVAPSGACSRIISTSLASMCRHWKGGKDVLDS